MFCWTFSLKLKKQRMYVKLLASRDRSLTTNQLFESQRFRLSHQQSLQALICSIVLDQDAFADKLLTRSYSYKPVFLQFMSMFVHMLLWEVETGWQSVVVEEISYSSTIASHDFAVIAYSQISFDVNYFCVSHI